MLTLIYLTCTMIGIHPIDCETHKGWQYTVQECTKEARQINVGGFRKESDPVQWRNNQTTFAYCSRQP